MLVNSFLFSSALGYPTQIAIERQWIGMSWLTFTPSSDIRAVDEAARREYMGIQFT